MAATPAWHRFRSADRRRSPTARHRGLLQRTQPDLQDGRQDEGDEHGVQPLDGAADEVLVDERLGQPGDHDAGKGEQHSGEHGQHQAGPGGSQPAREDGGGAGGPLGAPELAAGGEGDERDAGVRSGGDGRWMRVRTDADRVAVDDRDPGAWDAGELIRRAVGDRRGQPVGRGDRGDGDDRRVGGESGGLPGELGEGILASEGVEDRLEGASGADRRFR